MRKIYFSVLIFSFVWLISIETQSQTILQPNEGTRQIVWSPDGTKYAVANPDGLMQVWDSTGQLQLSTQAHTVETSSVSWHPSGNYLATGGYDNLVKIWDTNGNLVNTIDATRYFDGVIEVLWHPDGQRLITLGFNIMSAWNAFDTTNPFIRDLPSATVIDMKWSPDDSKLSVVTLYDQITTYDANTLNIDPTPLVQTDSFQINTFDWNPNGQHLILGATSGSVYLWDTSTQTNLGELLNTGRWIQDLEYSPNGLQLAIATDDGRTITANAVTGEVLETITETAPVLSVAWKPNTSELTYTGVETTTPVTPPLPNVEPYSLAGDDITLPAHDTPINLDGTGSYDVDGTIVSYEWYDDRTIDFITGEPRLLSTSPTPTLIPPTAPTEITVTYTLFVTDDEGAVQSDTVQVVVPPDPCLIVTCGPGPGFP